MLEGQQLAFRYAATRRWLFQNIDLHIAPGEVVGLYGPSGRGKTTLGKLLAGWLVPSAGRVLLDGQALPRRGTSPVQLLFQHPELSINPRWRIDRVLHEGHVPPDALLDALHIAPSWLTRWPHELSGGELQRIAVARALGPHTRYLIADEMTAMLDANTQAHIWQVVLTHARTHHLGVLVISHEAALLRRVCQHMITLSAADQEEWHRAT